MAARAVPLERRAWSGAVFVERLGNGALYVPGVPTCGLHTHLERTVCPRVGGVDRARRGCTGNMELGRTVDALLTHYAEHRNWDAPGVSRRQTRARQYAEGVRDALRARGLRIVAAQVTAYCPNTRVVTAADLVCERYGALGNPQRCVVEVKVGGERGLNAQSRSRNTGALTGALAGVTNTLRVQYWAQLLATARMVSNMYRNVCGPPLLVVTNARGTRVEDRPPAPMRAPGLVDAWLNAQHGRPPPTEGDTAEKPVLVADDE